MITMVNNGIMRSDKTTRIMYNALASVYSFVEVGINEIIMI